MNDSAAGVDAGHVRVYQKSGSTWTQLGGDIDGESAEERSGISVGMSADGSRVVIGAYLNGGSVPRSGAGQVRVYELVAGAWVQVGTDINGSTGSGLGYAVAISADGRRIIAGAPGINSGVGYAQVYEQTGSDWVQLGATLAVTGSSSFGAGARHVGRRQPRRHRRTRRRRLDPARHGVRLRVERHGMGAARCTDRR